MSFRLLSSSLSLARRSNRNANFHASQKASPSSIQSFLSTCKSRSKSSSAIKIKQPSNTTTSTSASASTSAAKPKAPAAAESSSSTTSSSVPLAQTALAAIAGIATVSIAAYAVESSTASSCPPFDPSDERFDQSTYIGRFSKMILACDPRLLTYSEEQTRRSQEMVADFKQLLTPANIPDNMTAAQMNHALWEAQRIASASLHPDSGDSIPAPFRMCGYVPYNGPICVSMVASTSTPSILLWSWVNQSQNALVNYYNRNASSELDNATLLKSYTAAVSSALIVAFGLATFIQKRFTPDKAKQLMRWVAFPSAVVASSLNCYIVRSPEISSGIPLLNSDYENISNDGRTSQIAAKQGVYSTTASRALLQAPVYFLPPVLMGTIPFLKNIIKRNPAMSVPLTTYLVLVSFGLGLPATVAIFPQMAEIDIKDVEEEFQGLRDPKTGLPYQKLYYNKGL